jgi:NAD(P)-dependent dehydrogenase (short-subunit alcohol dehydrogenase family)
MTTEEKSMGKLEGKIALITGGNSGIGLATARQFVNEGAYVFITGRREPELAAAVKEIGTNVTGVQGDVSNLGDLDRLFAQITREKGRLDTVFANAGVATFASFGTITEEHSTTTRSSTPMLKACFSRCRRRFRCCRMEPRSS